MLLIYVLRLGSQAVPVADGVPSKKRTADEAAVGALETAEAGDVGGEVVIKPEPSEHAEVSAHADDAPEQADMKRARVE